MILLLISSFFFALLESARVTGLHTKADVTGDLALESVFAEYQKDVYDSYGLLLLDGAYGSGKFQIEKVERRLEEMNGKNLHASRGQMRDFYQLEIVECKIPRYQLATDDHGDVFRHLAAETAKKEAAALGVEDFTQEIAMKENLEKQNGSVEEYLEEAQKAKDEALELQDTKDDNISAPSMPQDVENPIDEANNWKKSAVLSMVVRDEAQLSRKAISVGNCLERRQKQEGSLKVQGKAPDEMWFFKYLENHMGTYGNPKQNRVLDYEMEYILQGESSDRENLEGVVKNLIAIREILNLAFLAKDPQKQVEAEELAAALMGWSVNPLVISATKWGILGAWAYMESILDVRALLEGKKIAWMKSSEQWTSGIGQMNTSMEGFSVAKDCENGWNYTKYLQFLLCLKKDRVINYRSMDLIEVNTNINKKETIQMDHMLAACESEVIYEAEPLFWQYVSLGNFSLDVFDIRRSGIYSYL